MRRIAFPLENNLRAGFFVGNGIDLSLVHAVATQSDLELMFSRADQHGVKPPSEVSSVADVIVVEENCSALGLNIQSQFGGIVAGIFGGWRAARLRPADALSKVA